MTRKRFHAIQTELGLSNAALSQAIGANEGSVSKWRRGLAPVPLYIQRLLELLVQQRLQQTILQITLTEHAALYQKVEESGLTLSEYLTRLIRDHITP